MLMQLPVRGGKSSPLVLALDYSLMLVDQKD